MPRRAGHGTGFDEIADELYGRPGSEFTAARDAATSEARSAGDADLAAALRKLRRPTAAAWLANALVRERPREVAQLVELGSRIRTAQAELDAGALRRLSQQRHDLVIELSREARRLARDRGEKVSDATARELEETLEAASLDPDAAAELRGGRLTRGLAYSGMGFSRTAGTAGTTASRQAEPDRQLARQEVREARRAVDRARAALTTAGRTVERERAALLAAEAEVARRREAVAAAKRDERRARGELEAAEREARRSDGGRQPNG